MSNFQPPIVIDPTTDKGHQLAFINQNFQTLSAVLETNSFRVVLSDVVSITASANSNNTTTIPHNLGFIPIPFCFLSASNDTQYFPLPQWTALTRDDVNNQVKFGTWIDDFCDVTNLYIQFFNSTNSTNGPFNIRYYLLQKAAK